MRVSLFVSRGQHARRELAGNDRDRHGIPSEVVQFLAVNGPIESVDRRNDSINVRAQTQPRARRADSLQPGQR